MLIVFNQDGLISSFNLNKLVSGVPDLLPTPLPPRHTLTSLLSYSLFPKPATLLQASSLLQDCSSGEVFFSEKLPRTTGLNLNVA